VETVREFRVITNAYDAEYGRHTGAVVSAITKSGTNEFHGSLFEFLRNDNLDAPRWETNAFAEGKKPEFRRNQFGAAVGGPILRDRAFFFGSYEGLREELGQTQVYDVPGIALRNSATVDPEIRPYLLGYPLPNVIQSNGTLDRADGRGQFSKPIPQVTDEDFLTGRVDLRISDSSSLFGRVNTDDASKSTPGMTTEEVLSNENRFFTLEETHIYTPALLGRTHFSFNRTRLDSADFVLPEFSYPDGFDSFDGGEVPGRITVSTLSAWGGGSTNPKHYVQNVFQFKEDFYYSRGRHSLKFGGLFERFQLNDISGFHDGGSFGFASVADFLANRVSTANFVKPGSDNVRGSRQNLLGLFLQDDISLRPGLTVNLGLRYEIINSPIEVNGKMSNIRDLTAPHINTVTEATVDIGEPYFTNPSLKNFAPRAGIAWDPFGTGKTSIRAGAGVYHDQILAGSYRSPLGRSGPFYAVAGLAAANFTNLGGIDFPTAYFTQVKAGLVGAAAPQFDGIEWNMDQPTVYKWSFDIQRELPGGMTAEAGYAGTRSTHLLRSEIMFNTTPSLEPANGRARFILIAQPVNNPNFDRVRWRTSDATSDYHGLRLSLSKRFSRGFQFQTSYTFSKATDDSSNWVGSGDFGDANRPAYRMDKEHALAGFDVRQSFTANGVVELPGRNLPGAAGKILGGWSLSSILRLNSGNPVSLSAQQARISSQLQMRFVNG
ncbi:MAG TPA: TonB-dependent receptor, partial [Terriglobia bacterium]|nr:TonB-dependent receptor [Terriglobia bacterium]